MTQKTRPNPIHLLQASKPLGTVASYPAMPLEQNGQKFYLTTIPKEDIFPYCFVADRFEDSEQGFQRALDLGRAREIASYLDNGRGSIPTCIVLSARADAALSFNSKTKAIQFKRKLKGFLVLDGQHRLYGYGLTQKGYRVPVAIYEGLTTKAEVALFIDINTTQRGVPAALLLDIKQLADREMDHEKRLRELFDYLGTQSDSPFFGFMSPSQAARGHVSRPGFNRAVGPIFQLRIMESLPKEKQHELFKNYLRAIELNLSDPKLLKINVYLEAFCAFFEEAVRLSRERSNNCKFPTLAKVLNPLRTIDFSNMSAKGKARLTKSTILDVIREQMMGPIYVEADMV